MLVTNVKKEITSLWPSSNIVLQVFISVVVTFICELKRALYGIKCVLRIFLTNMAEHTIEEKKFDAL